MKPSQVKKANQFQTQNLTPVKASNSAVLNLRAAPAAITSKYLEHTSSSNKSPPSSPKSPISPEFIDTSSANYNEIFLHERDRDLEEEKVFFSPLPRSKQLAVNRQNSDHDLTAEEPLPSSAALQALVENHDPDTKYPPDYFAPPSSPPRQTVDEPEDDESDWVRTDTLFPY